MFQTLLLKILSFLHFIVFAPLSKISFVYRPHMHVGLFLGSLFHSTDLFVYSFSNTTCVDKCSLTASLEIELYQSFDSVLLLQCCVGYSGSFASLYKH